MRCPACGSPNNKVVDTRRYDQCIIRVRVCDDCGQPWRTAEGIHVVIEKTVTTFENH